jgi:hypothetical protein
MVFESVDVAHSEKCPLRQRHLKKMNLWTHNLWLLVGPVAGVTPLACLQNLPRPQSCCSLGPLLHNSHCPKPVQISGLGTGTRFSLMHTHRRLLTEDEYLVRLIITQLEQVVKQ